MYRHGDVILEKTDMDPTGEPMPRKDGKVVLADGKTTGHAHVIDGDADFYAIPDADPLVRGLLVVRDELPIGHEEHRPERLPPGHYIVRLKRRQNGDSWSAVVD